MSERNEWLKLAAWKLYLLKNLSIYEYKSTLAEDRNEIFEKASIISIILSFFGMYEYLNFLSRLCNWPNSNFFLLLKRELK